MTKLARTLALALSFALPLALVGCGGEQDVVLVGGQKVDAQTVDKDPLALLPGSAVAVAYLDAQALFQTPLGTDTGQLITALLPLGPEAGFVPSRDVLKVYGGVYAMQGADYCFVVQGTFDTDAIKRSVDAQTITPLGVPLVKSRYAESDFYTAGNIGFVPLTQHTMLTGTEIGMRRALDRLRFGKLERQIPKWMLELIATPSASFALAADLATQIPVESALAGTPLVTDLKVVRVIGNFQPPGLNFAGTLTYASEQSASNGAAVIQSTQQFRGIMGVLSAFGLGVALPAVDVAQNGKDVAVTMPVDESTARSLLRYGTQFIQKKR